MASYRDLVAWQKAMRLTVNVYSATQHFPGDELYGLRTLLRRAAVSVPSNIAEGQARFANGDFQRFLSIARGSLAEVETQHLLCRKLQYVTLEETNKLLEDCAELGRILNGLRESLLRDR